MANVTPLITPTLSDAVYMRVDAGNSPATQPWTFPGLTVSAATTTLNGGTLNGTYGGNPAFSGSPTLNGGTLNGSYSGNPTLSGTTTLTTANATTLNSSGGALNGSLGASTPAAATTTSLTATGNVTAVLGQNQIKAYSFDSVLWVDGIKYTTLAGCYADIPSTGGVCVVPPNYSETLAANLVLSKSSAGFRFNGPATITGAFGVVVNDGVNGAFIVGPYAYGGLGDVVNSRVSHPVKFTYTGSGNAILASSSAGTLGVESLTLRGITVDISGAGTNAIAIDTWCLDHSEIRDVSIQATNGSQSQIGIRFSDCTSADGSATSGANTIANVNIFFPKIALQLNGNMRENDFGGMRLLGQATPLAASIGIDFEGTAKSNFFHGGTATNWITAINFGGTNLYNDIHMETDLLAGGAGAKDVVFGASSSNNEVVRATDTDTPVYSDSGTFNCIRNVGAQCHVNFQSTAPTSCAVTGAGASATCTFAPAATDQMGLLLINAAGAGPASTGTITLTFATKYGSTRAMCFMQPGQSGTTWNARASILQQTYGTASAVMNWDNNAVALVAGNTYGVGYFCGGV